MNQASVASPDEQSTEKMQRRLRLKKRRLGEHHATGLPRFNLKLFITIVLGSAVLAGLLVMLYDRVDRQRLAVEMAEHEVYLVELMQWISAEKLRPVVADLQFLTRQNEAQQWLHNDTPDVTTAIAAEYQALVRYKQVYDQLRLIDLSGQERIRVEFNGGNPQIIAPGALHNQAAHHYVIATLALEPGAIYLSSFDLAIDPNLIERPLKPTIRFSAPLADNNQRVGGMVILNYRGNELLQQLKAVAQLGHGQAQLVNDRGDWLLAPPGAQAWGFMFEEPQDRTFALTYPQVWQQMLNHARGQIEHESGLFTYARIEPAADVLIGAEPETGLYSADQFWLVVSHLPTAVSKSLQQERLLRLLLIGGALWLVGVIIAAAFVMILSRWQLDQARLKNMTHFDQLTQLPNRTLFTDRLERLHIHARRYNRAYALIYISLNGVDKVNEQQGDGVGDELLVRVARLLVHSLRQSDTVSRISDDEFAILLSYISDLDSAVRLGEKAVAAISAPMRLRRCEVEIGANAGVAMFPVHGNSADELMRLARHAMSTSKAQGTNQCSVASPLVVSEQQVST